jgi:autotransporter-associated beta strand protein
VLGGNSYTPVLTSGGIDPVNDGWLRLTDNANNRATYAYYDTAVSSANRTVFTSFDYASYNGTGADGITFFLFDGSVEFSEGAFGGSMGYAPKTIAGGGEVNKEGLAGGYLAVSLDDFGNFSNPTEGRTGGPGSRPNAVAVRGPGDGYSGYEFIAGTGDGTTPALTQQLDFPGSTTRPNQTGADYRHVEILITPTNQLTVWLQFGTAGALTKVLEADLSGYLRPETLKFGFTSGTGGQTEIHELRSLTVATLVANLWDNGANGGSSATGDWSVAANWNPDVPATGDDILFDNTFVSTAQTVNVGTGTNRTIRSVQIDAPFSYTLENGTLNFDNVGLPGFLGISVTQTNGVSTTGNTINSAITLASAATIRNATTSTLTLNGTIANGGKTLTFDGAGNTTASGVISGTGALVKEQTGNLTLTGNNTYSGGTAVSGGTITVGHNNALGTGAVTMTGGALAGSAGQTIGNAVVLQGDAGVSNLTVSGTVSQTGGNRTLTLEGTTITGTVTLAENNQTRTLTTHVVSASTISGAINDGAGSGADSLTKTGTGTLTLSGVNGFTGNLTVNEGTVLLGGNSRLNDAVDVSIGSSGTLNLGGFSERIDNLTAFDGATIDFGTPGGANNFLFDTYTAPSSGVLVIKNWETNDMLATTIDGQTVDSIYISGYGVAQQAATTSTIGTLGTGYLLTAVPQTHKEWDGSSSSVWSTNNNWTASGEPSTTQVALFGDLGLGRTAVSLDASYTIRGITFDTDATSGYTITSSGNGTQSLTLTYAGGVPFIQQKSASTQTIAIESLILGGNTVADITGSGDLVISAPISQTGGTRSLIRDGSGSGKLILSGNNTFSGGVYINTGIVEARNDNALGSGAATIASGAALELSNSIDISEAISLGGSGVGGNGAIRSLSGSNTLSGNLTLTGDTRFQADSTATLTLSGANALDDAGKNLTFGGAGTIAVSKVISTGTGTVTKEGAGTLTLSGINTFTGVTTVNEGTLVLATSGGNSVGGNLVIGNGTGTDTVRLNAANQIANTATVTLNNGGVFNLNGFAETVAGLNSSSSGSQVQLGTTGALTLNNSTANTYAGTFTGSGGITKDGVGRLTLSGSSGSYSGTTTINNGIVAVQTNTALGTGSVVVAPGGNVEVQGNITMANNFTIRGDGTGANDGAIENFSGNNTLTGNIALNANARIGSSSGTLTLNTGTLTGTNHNLTISGAGNTVMNRNINTGTGTLTKEGSGTLTLNTANSYTGATTIAAGRITAGTTGIFSDAASLTINTTAVYDMANHSETVGSLLGGGAGAGGSINFGGATLTLASGASDFGGDFGFTNGTIVINAGASLTLTDSFNAANINIILNGGTLNLGSGLTHTFGNLTVTGAGTSVIDFGTSGATIAEFDTVNVPGAGTLAVNNWTDYVDYFIATTSPGPQGSSPTNKVVFNGFVGNDTKWTPLVGGNGQLTPVPEPSTYGAVFLGGAASLFWLRRHRKSKHNA